MKKLTLLFAVAFAVVGSAMAQMAIPGEVFAGNPSRFNGRKVTIKNIEIVKTDAHGGPSIGGPAGTFRRAALLGAYPHLATGDGGACRRITAAGQGRAAHS